VNRQGRKAKGWPPRKPWRIVLAIDEPDRAELLRRFLERAGHHVVQVSTAELAAVETGRELTACVVLNLTLAGGGGNLRALSVLRANANVTIARARVVFCGEHAANRLFAWESGADGFLPRPFAIDALLKEIDAVVTRPADQLREHRRRQRDAAALGIA